MGNRQNSAFVLEIVFDWDHVKLELPGGATSCAHSILCHWIVKFLTKFILIFLLLDAVQSFERKTR